jgi:DNA-binding NtrC family response regulator
MGCPAHVLIVEDDADSRNSLPLLLTDMGYRVSSAASGAEALRYVDSGEIGDAVITEVLMPGMSGVEFARRAGDGRPGLPIVLLTGKPDGIESAVDSGAVPLLKPVTFQRLGQVPGDVFGERLAPR